MYNSINAEPDTFILTCRTAFNKSLFPFQSALSSSDLYRKLEQIALSYKHKGDLNLFCTYLQEGQYYINIWAAYFLLGIFELTGEEKLTGSDEKENIVAHCYLLIESQFQQFSNKEQIRNCSFWLEQKRKEYKMYIPDSGSEY